MEYLQSKCTPAPHGRSQAYFVTNANNRPILQAYLQMVVNEKTPHHEGDTFSHINGVLYKWAMDATYKYLALVIPNNGISQNPLRHTISWATRE